MGNRVSTNAKKTLNRAYQQVAAACGPGKSADVCEALFKQHATFLSLPHSPALSAAFVAMVQDHYNNIKEEEGDVDESVRHAEEGEGHATASDLDADDEGASQMVRDNLIAIARREDSIK